MSYTFWLSKRLKLNGSRGGVNATGVTIAIAGIAIALIIMEFTISIVLGFKHQITDRITGFEGKVWILPDYNYNIASQAPTIGADTTLMKVVERTVPGAMTYMRFEQPGILKTENDFVGVYFCGDALPDKSSFESQYVIEGKYPDFSSSEDNNKIVLSKQTANTLGLKVDDTLNACFFINDAIKSRKFSIAAIYETGFSDYDCNMVFASPNTLRKIAAADSLSGTKMIVDISPDADIEQTAALLQEQILQSYHNQELEKLYPVDNVRHTGAIYFNWLELLNTNVVAIFVLMICVSGFTLVSSMFIIILERIPTIGILRSLGSTKRQIRSLFVYLALKIVGIGLIIGNIVGLLLLYIQQTYNILTLDAEMYYLKYVPVEINWTYIILLNIGVIIISWLILILPSRVASGISPAVTMRFE